jgi:protein TonB
VSSGLASALLTSLLVHLMGFTALSMVGGSLWSPSPPSNLIAAELLVAPPPPAVPEPVPPPELAPMPPQTVEPVEPLPAIPPPAPPPQPVTPPRLVQITPPKLVEKPRPERATPRVKTPPPTQPGPPLPLPAEAHAANSNVLGPPAEQLPEAALPQPVEGGEAGAGKLFDRGDVGVVPGTRAGGGSGGPGRAGLGTGGAGASGGPRVAGVQPGAGGLARPLGGYQVTPRYPESARRQGAQGTTLLKMYVSDRGLVEDVLVEGSAGHQDLDLAAMEAVKKWRFEPAKRGNQPIAVWVMLPVRFALR